jgi:ketosteroid isomerase-like protein
MEVLPNFQDLMDRMAAAYCAGNAASCAALFTADAHLYSPYAPPAIGRLAIEALHSEWVQEDVKDKELQVLQTGGSHGCAWTLNSYSERDGEVRGTSLTVWQLDDDGEWRIRMCSLNGVYDLGSP